MGVANAGTGAGPAGTGPAATASRVLGPPPASVDFVSQVSLCFSKIPYKKLNHEKY
jgi:hypothetical protein